MFMLREKMKEVLNYYAIDATKLENELGWKADENFDSGIIKTIEWYLKKYRISDKGSNSV